MNIVNVVSQRSLNFGDAMREIFQSGTVRSDFILVTGDIVSNAKLTDVIAAHKCEGRGEHLVSRSTGRATRMTSATS